MLLAVVVVVVVVVELTDRSNSLVANEYLCIRCPVSVCLPDTGSPLLANNSVLSCSATDQ